MAHGRGLQYRIFSTSWPTITEKANFLPSLSVKWQVLQQSNKLTEPVITLQGSTYEGLTELIATLCGSTCEGLTEAIAAL